MRSDSLIGMIQKPNFLDLTPEINPSIVILLRPFSPQHRTISNVRSRRPTNPAYFPSYMVVSRSTSASFHVKDLIAVGFRGVLQPPTTMKTRSGATVVVCKFTLIFDPGAYLYPPRFSFILYEIC